MRCLFCVLMIWQLASGGGSSLAETNVPGTLTLANARAVAVRNHPKISEAQLRALAAQQMVTETRSAFFPTASLNVTAVGSGSDNTRIAAGGLNNPTVFDRNAEGLIVNQLITDFGRTANLSASYKFRARAEDQNAEAARELLLLQVAIGYFNTLQSQAVLGVAQQTVNTRQLLLDQVSTLASNKLKSELDVSFARVALEEGNLLLARSRNDLKAALAALSTLLGFREQQEFQLVEEPLPTEYPTNISELIVTALSRRPDLLRFRDERDAAAKLAQAEKKLDYPTIAAIGVAGVSPIHDDRLKDDYAAAGVNLSLPLFNGNLFSARKKEAALRAKATVENLRDAENNVTRDVRVAWLNLNNAVERLKITEALVENAGKAFDLAQARYKVGSSSIVELSQAQLNLTGAQIASTAARYDVQIQQANLDYQIGGVASEARRKGIH
ncbi:MAG TPA: TolC family protein [Candidatus Angelobacter sp.]|nr:TolC family protein [Candidatus Angelobacter sp.]